MKHTILIFSSICIALLLLFQLEKWSLFAMNGSRNVIFIVISILFLILGVFTSRYFFIKKQHKKKELAQSNLSNQELKVLQLIAEGKSNKEIANDLFIAETTVKTHVSNIFSKLNAKRRTEAMKIAQELSII